MSRFIDNNDGTITDPQTGLVWSKETIAVGVMHTDTDKILAEFGEGWRLPTVQELFSLVDHAHHDPAINTEFFPGTRNEWYWTSTPCAWNRESARWVVGFLNGVVLGYYRSGHACVRACRAGQ